MKNLRRIMFDYAFLIIFMLGIFLLLATFTLWVDLPTLEPTVQQGDELYKQIDKMDVRHYDVAGAGDER